MKKNRIIYTLTTLLAASMLAHADETFELQTTIIQENKESPQIIYMVPWEETKVSTKKEEHKLVLHSLYGDLFEPILPDQPATKNQ